MGHFGHTYLPMSNVFYTTPITLVLFMLRYLPTPKSDVLNERSHSVVVIALAFHLGGLGSNPGGGNSINFFSYSSLCHQTSLKFTFNSGPSK